YDHKLSLMKENIDRLGITNITLENFNALDLDQNLIDQVDKVLLDVPCSGLGILRRKPDLKWNKKIEDLASLTSLQLKILENAARYVKKGGTIVYSTCTINREENLNLVKTFLDQNSSFQLATITPI